MDIKAFGNKLIPNLSAPKAPVHKEMKSEQTMERDANGQTGHGNGEQHQPMTDEEIQKVVEYLKALGGVKDSGLLVNVRKINDRTFVLIEDPLGKVIRRIPETDLYHLLQKTKDEKQTGNLLDKAM